MRGIGIGDVSLNWPAKRHFGNLKWRPRSILKSVSALACTNDSIHLRNCGKARADRTLSREWNGPDRPQKWNDFLLWVGSGFSVIKVKRFDALGNYCGMRSMRSSILSITSHNWHCSDSDAAPHFNFSKTPKGQMPDSRTGRWSVQLVRMSAVKRRKSESGTRTAIEGLQSASPRPKIIRNFQPANSRRIWTVAQFLWHIGLNVLVPDSALGVSVLMSCSVLMDPLWRIWVLREAISSGWTLRWPAGTFSDRLASAAQRQSMLAVPCINMPSSEWRSLFVWSETVRKFGFSLW